MSKSLHRVLYWDGSRNVEERTHRLDLDVTCQGVYLTSSAPPAPKVMPTITVSLSSRKQLMQKVAKWGVPSGIRVRVKKVDEWFVPLKELASVHITLKEASQIQALVFLVYNRGQDCVYFERLDAAAIGKLPDKDESVDDKQKKKPFAAKAGRERADADSPGDRFTVRVWVSMDPRAFTNLHPSMIPPLFPRDPEMGDVWDPWTTSLFCDRETLSFTARSRMPPADIARMSLDKLRATAFYDYWHTLLKDERGEAIPDEEIQAWGAWYWRKESRFGEDHLGRNVIAASPVIEQIFAGAMKIKVEAKEPTGDKRGEKGEFEAKGDSFPEFPDMIKRVMYESCAHSGLGLALLDNVARGPHPVTLYPVSASFFNEVGGTAYDGALKDDTAVLLKVKDVIGKLNAKKWAEVADVKKWEGVTEDAALLARFFTTGAIKSAKKNVVTFAARRAVYCEMGASSRKGCASKFYFGVQYVKTTFGGDRYEVKRHVFTKKGTARVKVRPDEPSQAGDAYDAPIVDALPKFYFLGKDMYGNDKWVPIDVETPFFLAFLHEMIHARRFQMGLNAEWDEILTSAALHPDAMVAQMRAGGAADADVKNIIFRYSGESGKVISREEFDTVEGYGAPVEVRKDSVAHAIAAKHAIRTVDGPPHSSIVFLNENALRLELGLDLRARYLSSRVGDKDGERLRAGADDVARIPRKYRPKNLEEFKLEAEPFKAITLGDLAANVGALIKSPAAFKYEPGKSIFMFGRQKMGAAYAFKNLCGVSVDELGEELSNLTTIFTALKSRARYIKQDLGDAAQELFKFAPDSKEDFPDPPAGTDPRGDYNAKMQRLVAKVFCGLLALQTEDDWQVVVSQGSDELARLMANGEPVEAFCALSHKSVQPAVDLGPGKTPLGTIADKLAFVYNTAPRSEPNTIHLYIHEPMHISSFRTEGFRIWPIADSPPPSLKDVLDELKKEADRSWGDWLTNLRDSTMDEGTTEMLARIITYRTNVKLGKIASEVELFAGIPSYEYPVRFVVELVKLMAAGIGDGKQALSLLVDAYVNGKFTELNDALERTFSNAPWDKARVKKLVEPATQLRKETIYYLSPTPPSRAVDNLKKDLGFNWPTGPDLVQQIVEGKYRDPVITELGAFADALDPDPGAPKIADYYTSAFKPSEKPHFAHVLRI